MVGGRVFELEVDPPVGQVQGVDRAGPVSPILEHRPVRSTPGRETSLAHAGQLDPLLLVVLDPAEVSPGLTLMVVLDIECLAEGRIINNVANPELARIRS